MNGIEGHVVASYWIGQDCQPNDINIIESVPPDVFDEVAIRALSRWCYEPQENNSKRTITQRLDFTLESVDLPPLRTDPDLFIHSPMDVDTQIIPLVRIGPIYPTLAAAQQVTEGVVVVEFTVHPSGDVYDPVIVESSPPGMFDKAALSAIHRWKFKPATVDGQAVAIRAIQRFDFSLP